MEAGIAHDTLYIVYTRRSDVHVWLGVAVVRKGSREPIKERLNRFIDKSAGPYACWPWTGGRIGPKGDTLRSYGMFIIERKGHTASSVMYEEYVGPIPEGMRVCHACDNPPCMNPRHLFVDTAKGNTQDMLRKGRGRSPGAKVPLMGEANPGARLTEATVREMRALYRTGVSYTDVGRRFGASTSQARAICLGLAWKHVT